MSRSDDFAALRVGIQDRLLRVETPRLPTTAWALLQDIRNLLVGFSNEGLLKNPPREIHALVKRTEPSAGRVALTVCSPANFRRDRSLPHLERDDGAWFDFHLDVRERGRQPLEIVAYGFELRFDVNASAPTWVRFDLNPPGTDNDRRGVRSHLHPATDDWSVPSPILTPIELLSIMVLGMRPEDPNRLRAVE